MFKYLRILFSIILMVALVSFQRSFVDPLPSWFGQFNSFIPVLIFTLVLAGAGSAVWWALGLGAVMDIYSFLPFGLFIVTALLTVLFANFLYRSFFTNRSLYSFGALVLFSTFFYETMLRAMNYFMLIFNENVQLFILQKSFWSALGQEIIINLGATFIIFYIFNFVSNRFRPVFIKK